MAAERSFEWATQLRLGEEGADAVLDHLQSGGHRVIDLSHEVQMQRRDIDALVDDLMVEIKTDSHAPKNFFFELAVEDKPGCLFASRADYWLYAFPRTKSVYWLHLPTLQQWIAEHRQSCQTRKVISRRAGHTWTATGILVPIVTLASALPLPTFSLEEPHEYTCTCPRARQRSTEH